MKNFTLILVFTVLTLSSCKNSEEQTTQTIDTLSNYFDYSNNDDQFTGGIKMIPINTPKGIFKVWTKRVGNNPTMKVLLLHGGPGFNHEYLECFDGYLPKEGIEYFYYDQLESYYSDQPNDSTLWTIEHFVDEVDQVREALHLNKDNFYLYGSSWGGMLAMEYALKHQDHLKGLIISNMMASIPAYEKYAAEVLGPQLPPEVYKEIKVMEANNDFANPKYEELVMTHYYPEHVLRMPVENWPDPVMRTFEHYNANVYVFMQGYSEFGVTGNASLKGWDISDRLKEIKVPTLTIGATYDTMDPKYMEWMSTEVQNGRFLLCPNGSHLAMYDDQKTYFEGLVKFVKDVDSGDFEK